MMNFHDGSDLGLLAFMRISYLYIVCLWGFLQLLLGSVLLSVPLILVLVSLIHVFRFPQVSGKVTKSICLVGDYAKKDGSAVLFGHRGASVDMPENTLCAFEECRNQGGDGIELDVELTSDGVTVILHDDTVDRTTDGQGRINDMTFDEARKLNAAARHTKKDIAFEPIPTLEEALKLSLEVGLHVFIEVKSSMSSGMQNAMKAGDAIAKLYAELPDLYETAMVCSFDPRALYQVRVRDSGIATAMIWRPWANSYTQAGEPTKSSILGTFLTATFDLILNFCLHGFLWHFLGFTIVSVNKNELSASCINWWRQRGVEPVTWTVNTFPDKAFFARHGVPVMTDSMTEDVPEQT